MRKKSLFLLTRLAIKDLWFDRKISFCIVAALIAVIAPLMLLFSLKYGTIEKLRQDLLNNPTNLEVNLKGISLKLTPAQLEWIQQQPETGFAIFRIAKLDAEVRLNKKNADLADALNDVTILATAKGDPVTHGFASLSRPDGIILSHNTNKTLHVNVGDVIEITVYRKFNQVNEIATLPFVVEGILPPLQYRRESAFVSLDFLRAMDSYKRGEVSTLQHQSQPITPEQTFPNARIYAKDLDDVKTLSEKIEEKFGIKSETNDADIEAVKKLNDILATVFLVIAVVSLIGCSLSLGGSFWANIDRKRKEIALLQLLGFQGKDVITFLILQSIALTGLAYLISLLVYSVGSVVYNKAFISNISSRNFVSAIPWSYQLIALLATLLLASLIAFAGGLRAIRIQPAESLREI